MKIWVLFLGQICFTSHLPHYNNSSQIGFNQIKGELKKMKSIGQNLEESNTYSIFVYAISLKYYKIFRKICLSSFLLYSFIILFEIPTKPQYMKLT